MPSRISQFGQFLTAGSQKKGQSAFTAGFIAIFLVLSSIPDLLGNLRRKDNWAVTSEKRRYVGNHVGDKKVSLGNDFHWGHIAVPVISVPVRSTVM